ncbi:hypothetical protein [Actinoplanes sp. L3-i22]|uniref:hypothetical protein n=1 Tax=Actinoplanes sp. L3-i22 TaxID=2836373 RepID=UPI001C75EB28|nr:hypothetical protein [Actinoplanes sp. L3-i22]BCY07330.1 hypothetical protein L3i22_024180 [Actinoplanes sp. L3-i22]
MQYLDLVEKWIVRTTGRTLDQHATEPIPAAAHLPAAADQLRAAREHLMTDVGALRTELINGDDLTGSAQSVTNALATVALAASDYECARVNIDYLVGDPDRTAYVATNPAQPVRRRYVNPGDTVLIVLPHSEYLRGRQIAGRTVRAQINKTDVELDLDEYPGPICLTYPLAGIYYDTVERRFYHVRAIGKRRVTRKRKASRKRWDSGR